MDDTDPSLLSYVLYIAILAAIAGYYLARHKELDARRWALLCFLFAPALVALLVAKPKPRGGDTDEFRARFQALAAYDPEIKAAVERMAALGPEAVEAFRRAYAAVQTKEAIPLITGDLERRWAAGERFDEASERGARLEALRQAGRIGERDYQDQRKRLAAGRSRSPWAGLWWKLPLLLLVLWVLWPRGASAGPIGEHLDRIGGCRRPLHDSFSQEVSPFTPRPYGKALSDWSDPDLAEFRSYFLACAERRADGGRMSPANRAEAVRVIDTAVEELRFRIGMARNETRGQRAAQETRRREAESEGEKRRAEAERQAGFDTETTAVLAERDAFLAQGLTGLAPEEQVARLDGLIARMQVLGRQGAGLPGARSLWEAEQATRSRRGDIVRAAAQQRARQPIPVSQPAPETGPHTNFTILEMEAVRAAANPLRAEAFRADLARGVDLVARVGGFDRAGSDWLVRLVDGLGAAGRPGQGILCRVAGGDGTSLGLLREAIPGLSAVRVIAGDAEDVRFAADPIRLRIVLAPCRIAPPPDNSYLPGAPHPSDAKPLDLPSPTPHADLPARAADEPPPVAPSPPGLRCTTEVSRQRGAWIVARRLRRAWAIPEALRDDPSLVVTMQITLDHRGLVEPPVVARAASKRASPEQMQAVVEAAHRAVRESGPFPELGYSTFAPAKIDMIPCD